MPKLIIMKKNISPRLFFAVIGRGIKQAAVWVAKLFGYKEGTTFGKIVWRVFAFSASLTMLIIACVFTCALVCFIQDKIQVRKYRSVNYCHEYNNTYVSPYVIYHDAYDGGYIYNKTTGVRTISNVNMVCKSSDGDSLEFFVSNRKRGYFNRFTGELAISAQYDKAWVFSEGIACVYIDGVLTFIDHSGNAVMDRNFPYTERIDSYCFQNGLCAVMGDNELIGLIDKQGEWIVAPEYYYVCHEKSGFWKTEALDGKEGLLNAKGDELLTIGFYDIKIDSQKELIYARTLDHVDMIFDFDGKVVNASNYAGVMKLKYESNELDNDGYFKQAVANMMSYYTSGSNYGLIDHDGNLITKPEYYAITAISADRYLCEGPLGMVILNDKGEECKK